MTHALYPPPVVSPARRLRRAAIVTLLATTISAGGLTVSGCKKPDAAKGAQGQGPQAVAVDVAPARTDAVQRSVEVVGTLFGEEDTAISNKVPGRLIAIYKDVGDRVGPGEPLAQLLQNDYLLDLNQKRAALLEVLAKVGLGELPPGDFDVTNIPSVRQAKLTAANAESKFNRGRQLHEQKPPLLSDQDFEDLRTALDVARSAYDAAVLGAKGLLGEARTRHAELLQAEQALRDTTIRAPRPTYARPQFDRPSVTDDAADDGAGGAAAGAPTTQPAGTQPAGGAMPAARPNETPTTSPAAAAPDAWHSYVVAARYGNLGELRSAISPLFRLVDDDPLKLRAAVPERYFPEIGVGQQVSITVAAYAQPLAGKVSRINPQVDPANRTFPVEIIVPNPDHRVTPGAFANASIQTRVEPGVVFVPASAVVTFAGVDKVYVVADGKAKEVLVTLGDRRGDEFEIRKGLKGGETVATSGTSRLATGVPVTLKAPGSATKPAGKANAE